MNQVGSTSVLDSSVPVAGGSTSASTQIGVSATVESRIRQVTVAPSATRSATGSTVIFGAGSSLAAMTAPYEPGDYRDQNGRPKVWFFQTNRFILGDTCLP